MGIFGWSYPPGCSGPPDDDIYCAVCCLIDGNCICFECEICGEAGNPDCYVDKNGIDTRVDRLQLL